MKRNNHVLFGPRWKTNLQKLWSQKGIICNGTKPITNANLKTAPCQEAKLLPHFFRSMGESKCALVLSFYPHISQINFLRFSLPLHAQQQQQFAPLSRNPPPLIATTGLPATGDWLRRHPSWVQHDYFSIFFSHFSIGYISVSSQVFIPADLNRRPQPADLYSVLVLGRDVPF